MPQPQIILPLKPCLQPYGEYAGQAAVAANDAVNNKIASAFFMVLLLKMGCQNLLMVVLLALVALPSSHLLACLGKP